MRLLYITYDGVTDPIGQSQILPYLEGCANRGHHIHLISFEKPAIPGSAKVLTRERLRSSGIDWTPQVFHSFPPLMAKGFDLWLMERASRQVIAQHGPFDLLHARSYQAGWVALKIKRDTHTPVLFDMRGFWADQRREGGRWPDHSIIGDRLYRDWKRREAEMLAGADHVVVLAEAARNAVMNWPSFSGNPVSVIPCCADFSLFEEPDPRQRQAAKQRVGFGPDDPVLAYLGSIGTVYRFNAHLRLFMKIKAKDRRARLLHVGPAPKDRILADAREAGIVIGPDDLACIHAKHDDVGAALAAGDVGTAFCLDSFSSAGVSPTKVGEYLACGIPVISNDAVGDVAALFHELDCGHSIADFSDEELDGACHQFFKLRDIDRSALRSRAQTMFDLPLAVKAYTMIYDSLTPLRLPGD